MAAVAALLAILGAMFVGALLVDRWRTARLRAWASAHGFAEVDRGADGGALLAHAARFSRRVRSFGLTFHQATADDEVWIAEHRVALPTATAEKWQTLVVVRLPGAALAAAGPQPPEHWPHGGQVIVDGEYVRWCRQGIVWPKNVDETIARGRALARYFLGIVQK